MTKFKVGDKVRFIEDYMDYKKGDIVEVAGFWSEGINYIDKNKSTGCYFSRVELVEPKLTKNQRITALENEVAELKLIVHELRDGRKTMRDVMNEVLSEPSTTNNVKDIIEFEGQQYRKVDRLAREGDVVVLNDVGGSHYFKTNKPYKVQRDTNINGVGKLSGHKEAHPVYVKQYNRTPESVDVYELIEPKPLTPNQQRAAIIEKAKSFVEETEKYLKQPLADRTKGNYIYQESSNIVKFVINEEKRTIVALLYDRYLENKLNGKGIAKCNPSDVFNEHIGKAIALGRALDLDVSEFEQSAQPIEIVKGMEIMLFNSGGKDHKSGVVENYNSTADEATFSDEKTYGPYAEKTGFSRCIREHGYKILNDTDAIYGGVE